MMDWAHVLVIVQCQTDGCSLSCEETFRAVLTSNTPGDAINWLELARECNVAKKTGQPVPNGGTVLCKYAKEQGIDPYDYNTGSSSLAHVRGINRWVPPTKGQ